jgi:hypothetical protein
MEGGARRDIEEVRNLVTSGRYVKYGLACNFAAMGTELKTTGRMSGINT